jgi:osmoprotectant transport system substrate-binding protein
MDRDPDKVLATVRDLYQSKYQITVGPPLGFENTFAMVIRGDDAQKLHVTTLSQAAQYTPQWRLGVGYEFEQRPDGLRGLSAAYGLTFLGSPRTMDVGLLYRALEAHQVDMIAANSTDGPIKTMGLTALADDKHYFPPYQAVPLVRDEALEQWPEIGDALKARAGKVSADEMRTNRNKKAAMFWRPLFAYSDSVYVPAEDVTYWEAWLPCGTAATQVGRAVVL